MNVNLAPVLDVYRQAGNFIDQFGRSYSNHAHTVSWLGADFIRAQQQVGVAATAKHFPGLGAATRSQNTDLAPVTLNLSAAAIRGTDEVPYLAAIGAGVKLVMVSWAVYPALDREHPAGLSPAMVGGELRSRLGFKGVTITDALEAGALRAFGTFGHRAVLAAASRDGSRPLLGGQRGRGRECHRWPGERLPERRAEQDSVHGGRHADPGPAGRPAWLTRATAVACRLTWATALACPANPGHGAGLPG